MDLKMFSLALGKLSDELEILRTEMKEIKIQIAALKQRKPEFDGPQIPLHSEAEFITMQQVRKILKMSRNSVLQMVENGLIRQVRLTKRTIRYVKAEIQSLAL